MSTNRQRQQRLRDQRKESGLQRVTVWISNEDIDRLRKRFPGMRGGIDWAAIVAQAGGSANEPNALSDNGQERVRKPAQTAQQEPIPYLEA
jgi:hypothetical protein